MGDLRISSTIFSADQRQKLAAAKKKARKAKVKEDRPRRRQGVDRYA